MELSVRKAVLDDVGQVADVVNWAYRGKPRTLWQTLGNDKSDGSDENQSGWTGAQHLIPADRVTKEEVRTLLAESGKGAQVMLVCVATGDEKGTKGVVGSLKITKEGEGEVDFGLFGVDPELQSRGIGKRLFEAGETVAREEFKAHTGVLSVVNCREDVQAMYKRWGYQPTGAILPFHRPAADRALIPKDLHFVVFKKSLRVETASAAAPARPTMGVDPAVDIAKHSVEAHGQLQDQTQLQAQAQSPAQAQLHV